MIAFTVRLVLRSMRWVAPLLVLLIWVTAAVGGGGTGLELASVLFPAYVIMGTWLTIITGNVDDDAHRDLLAATAGSASRLHVMRSTTVLVMTGTIAVAVAVLVAVVAQPGRSTITVVVVVASLSLSGLLIGTGIGTLLHRPLLRHRGLSILLATGGCILVMLLAPIQSVHRSLNDGDTNTTWLLLTAALAWATASVLTASQLTDRRAR
jgi:hypothetical protein